MGANFKRNILLANANIRKAKGQTAAVIVLILLSSVMMNLWLMLSTDYKKNFDRYHDTLNDGHVNIAAYPVDEDFRKFICNTLENTPDVTDFSIENTFFAPVSFNYGSGEMSLFGVLIEKETALSRNVGKSEITEDSNLTSGIYLPMLYGTGNNYSVGDTIELSLFGEKFEYTVCGFFNNTMAGSHNCGLTSFLLTEDKFRELSEENFALDSAYISIRIKDKAKSEEIGMLLRDTISKEFPNVTVAANDYKAVTTARYVSQMLCAGIMSAMAFLILLIGIVVISSNVANYIQEDMQNLGALKAMGYTSRQLVFALIMQCSGISAAAAAVGAALSYYIFPAVNEMMIAQTGIPYKVKFLPLPFMATVFFIFGVVATAVYLSAKKIIKIEPITAIRRGTATHNFKKNHLPLEKTSLPIDAALAIKTTLSAFKQNVTVCVTILVLSLILVFSGVMLKNIIIDVQSLLYMMAGEISDSCINVNTNREAEFISELQADSRVEKFYLYTNNNTEAQHIGGDSLVVSIIDDASKLNNQSMIIQGRFPKYDNELAIAAKYAKDNGLAIGDEITLKIGNSSDKYIISGLVQITNNLGKDSILTREGYEKIGELPNVSYYIDIKDGTDIDDFNSEMSESFGSDINASLNSLSILESASRVYVTLATVIVIAVLIISCIIIIFVMYLLVRTLLNSKKRDYGILKALGFTTGQLVLQTAISFMPSVIISAAVGIFVSTQIINPLLTVFFSGLGIVRCTFTVPLGFNIIAGIGLVLFAFGAACLMSLSVKRIAPRVLLSGE